MRIYCTGSEKKELINKIYCNICGDEITKDVHGYFYDHLHVNKTWGYNSSKDGTSQQFDICEDCCNKMIHNFKVKLDKPKAD